MANATAAIDLNESRQVEMIVVCTVMLSIATIAVTLRCWSVYIQPSHKFGFDDLFAILTLPFIVSETALIYWWISSGLGLHAATVKPEDLARGPKIIFIASFLYDVAISFPKFSALFFYCRIFQRTHYGFYISLWIVGLMNAAWLISAWVTTAFQCTPIQAAWEEVEGSRCFPQQGYFLGTSIPSMIIDAIILILPLPLLWRFVHRKNRLLVTGVFVCGYCVIVISMGRFITLVRATDLMEDLTWTTVDYVEWVQCEGPISVMSVCLPNIFSLVRRVHKHGLRSALHRKHYGAPKAPFSLASSRPPIHGEVKRNSSAESGSTAENRHWDQLVDQQLNALGDG